jgi:hypothetical protein
VQVHFVPIKVGVVRRADAFIEAEGAVGHDAGAVRHDGELVEGGLAVEKHHVAVAHVALHKVADLQLKEHVGRWGLRCQWLRGEGGLRWGIGVFGTEDRWRVRARLVETGISKEKERKCGGFSP